MMLIAAPVLTSVVTKASCFLPGALTPILAAR
jgi:hypothetical protein